MADLMLVVLLEDVEKGVVALRQRRMTARKLHGHGITILAINRPTVHTTGMQVALVHRSDLDHGPSDNSEIHRHGGAKNGDIVRKTPGNAQASP